MTDVITNPNHLDSMKSWTAAARSLLAPPQYIDEDRGRVAALLHTILMIMIAATLLGFFAMINHPNPLIVASALSLLLFVELITFGLLRLKKERLSALILVSGLWLSFISLAAISEGLANSAFFGLVLVVTIAGLTLGGRAGLIFAGLSGFAGLGLMIGKANNLLPNGLIAFETFSFWALATVILLAAAGMIQLATNGLKKASDRAKNNELLQVEANRELQLVQANLEQIIQSRTQDLQNRSRYLQATIEVSRVASRAAG